MWSRASHLGRGSHFMKTNSLHGYQAEVLLKIKLPKDIKKKEHKPSTQLLLLRARVTEKLACQSLWTDPGQRCCQLTSTFTCAQSLRLSDNIEDNICEPDHWIPWSLSFPKVHFASLSKVCHNAVSGRSFK